ncbi:MAG TPA: hypothetical protein VNY52_06820 [Solirubrobacteraceae bacterium]|nr:hypothetical protein [Solirubrobacteraceae bacterium]
MIVTIQVAVAQPSSTPFAVEPGSFHVAPSTLQAGAHENLTTSYDLAHNAGGRTFNDLKMTVVNLPPGYIGNNTAVPTCSAAQLIGSVAGKSDCPADSQVGTISLDLTYPFGAHPVADNIFPIYNMEVTSFGVTTQLGFNAFVFVQLLNISLRPSDYGLTVTAPDTVNLAEPHHIAVTIWGVPASHEHDAQRGMDCIPENFITSTVATDCTGGGKTVNIAPKPFLSVSTSCTPTTATIEAYSWEEPERPSEEKTEIPATTACERVPFSPSIAVQPTTRSAESPTGLDVSLIVPQTWENPFSIATSNLKDTKVTLPEGVTANPSLASGLGACTPAQYEAETAASPPGAGCPAESKIGSIEIETPLLAEKIPGAIYIATPYDNPFPEPGHPGGSLLALYIVAKDPVRGIIVKVAGKIEPNPITGQLVTTFLNNPQQPFNRFTLKFRPGATAPLVSPPACGSNTTLAELTPWSEPFEPRLVQSSFETTQGVREGPCPAGGIPPFKPQVISGTQNDAGGSYSPFYLRILREDGEQEITRFSTTLPPGLTGNLTGIPFCPEADIEAAKGATGAQEEAEPSCPAASEIGHSLVGAGVGPVLAQNPGKIYLAGPYHGAPLSIVSITSAKVGPFDLGTVVIRFALNINPVTAQVEVSANGSDPIPHIIKGIVVHVRDVRVYMDREKFIINPTNCNPFSISDTIDGAGADFTNPADQVPVGVGTPFEVADCSSLAFKPTFKVSTSGRPSRADGESLSVKLSYPNAPQGTQTNIKLVKVELPRQLPSRLPTLQKACPEKTFVANPALCPAASVIGHATAITPILPVPLTGPAYFVSYGGAKFPELIIVLQGYGVTLDLHGETFISKQGITSSTFKTVPDDPIGSFELTLPQGPFSALAALGNPCKGTLTMPTEFLAQNGAAIHESTKVAVTGCPKAKKAARKKKARKAGRHKHAKQAANGRGAGRRR